MPVEQTRDQRIAAEFRKLEDLSKVIEAYEQEARIATERRVADLFRSKPTKK